MATIISPISPKYSCELCNVKTDNSKDFKNHLLTKKHRAKVTTQHLATIDATTISPTHNTCENCKKEYDSRSGLWRHKKICKSLPSQVAVESSSLNNNIIELLIKENIEFKSLLISMMQSNTELVRSNTDLQKQMVGNVGVVTNINSHNKTTFNMQLFLNEECKDAMNLKEFVDSISLTLADFEMVGEKGLVEGLSNIIIKSLRATDKFKRPIHCSDAKRDVMYVKDDNKWEKDGPRNDKVRSLVQNVEHKNIRLLNDYCKVHPDSLDPDSPLNDEYLRMSSIATSGTDEHLDKIITKLAKETVVEK